MGIAVLRVGGSDDVHVTYHHLSLLEGAFNNSDSKCYIGSFALKLCQMAYIGFYRSIVGGLPAARQLL